MQYEYIIQFIGPGESWEGIGGTVTVRPDRCSFMNVCSSNKKVDHVAITLRLIPRKTITIGYTYDNNTFSDYVVEYVALSKTMQCSIVPFLDAYDALQLIIDDKTYILPFTLSYEIEPEKKNETIPQNQPKTSPSMGARPLDDLPIDTRATYVAVKDLRGSEACVNRFQIPTRN